LKFHADENIAGLVIEGARQDGYSVSSISEVACGAEDVGVLEVARREQAISLTDQDVGSSPVASRRHATEQSGQAHC
jgi:hypothetical protein